MSSWQGGPQWSPGDPQWGQQPPTTSAPDWDQLAAEADQRRKRKRLLVIGGGAAATLAIGAAVAFGIVRESGGDDDVAGGRNATSDPAAADSPSDSPSPEPSFEETSLPPLPKPREFITDADKDIAPFSAESFFAGETMEIDDREYTRRAVADSDSCVDGATVALGEVLSEHGCSRLVRATFTGGSVAVTVGVAQFPTETDAQAAKEAAASHITALTSGDAPAFCERGGCRTTKNQVGRYAYFTIAGNSDNTPDRGDGTPAQQAARDGNQHAHARIVQRGENQASESADAIIRERNSGGAGEEAED
ncbi:hypothetical protein [Streptomyces otsuchiensis]|uniref:hypothetical protein n=1 Tax=Streptomyces otsuchiensis TaxID=2681388 RepID=UPI00102FBDFC|nr:hypothetical protein [Streptomyces otsuchiensis]